MRGLVFFCILIFAVIVTAGCSVRTENPPLTGNQSWAVTPEPHITTGGSALAVAFKENEISTKTPGAKERFIKGLTYLTQYARYNDSLEYFDAALAMDTNFSEAWVAKAVAFHNMQRYDDAIRCYDKALEISPGDAGTLSLKAITLRSSRNMNESS